MTSQVLVIDEILTPDRLASWISNRYIDWEARRQPWIAEKEEVQRYIFATDTTKTTNRVLPWSNKTTIPKLCQIRDNLHANYMATMFPKRKWLRWEGDNEQAEDIRKKEAIEAYMRWTVNRPEFYAEMQKLVYDYIDYGNSFATVEWVDKTSIVEGEDQGPREQVGYVGPMLRRISPLDIVFNPTASDFKSSPKVVRSLVSVGDIKEMLERQSLDTGQRESLEELYQYLREVRNHVAQFTGTAQTKDAIYEISGFESYRAYLESDYAEVLTFYGDYFEEETGKFHRNQVVKIVDRHKILSKATNPSFFGHAPIYHVGWRVRPDNLWAMGPLDNLVGLQYRIDHLENMKADVWDLTAYPPIKIKGFVDDFDWGPFEKINVSEDGDVELLSPDPSVLNTNTEIAILEQKMEEMAGAPKEAMGFRTPGEKTKYEVQKLENAAGRIFEAKTKHYERDFTEQLMNAKLELARRNVSLTTIRVFDDEFKAASFMTLSSKDITGAGRIKPIAARHFAERAQLVQDLTTFFSSSAGQDQGVIVHMSGLKLAQLWEAQLELEDFNIVSPFIRLTEQADAQRLMQSQQESVAMEAQTASGLTADDYDQEIDAEAESPTAQPNQSLDQGI
jgi:hypothetical protein